MAIAYKGGLVSSATGAGPFAIDVSSLSLASGDFVIVGLFAQASSNRTAPSCTGNSSGAFTNSADLFGNDTRPTNAFTWHKKLTGADTTITVGAPGFTNGISYFIRAYTGLDTTTQLDVAVTTATGINTDAADAPSITPTTSGAKIVAFYFGSQGAGATTWTAPSGLSNFDQAAFISGGSSYRTAAGDADWTSGAFDPAIVTNVEGNAADSWAAVTYALRPASGGATTHAATGALTGPGSTAAGTAAHIAIHPSSGTLTGQLGSVTGSAARTRQHAATGALTGQGSTLSGAATRFRAFASSGTLTGPGSTVAGSANRFREMVATGDLVGDIGTLDGSAARVGTAAAHAATGALIGIGSEVFAVAERQGFDRGAMLRGRRRRRGGFSDYGIWRV